ncbi:MAG TPA: aspartate kinase [Planctomycetota bacterium]|nr:aspartate kinase [Planctomycetota bacterium]
MALRVYKFGGSCLTNTASLGRVRSLIESGGGAPVVCVFSALQGVTDRLLEMARRALLGDVDTAALLGEHAAYLKGVASADRRAQAEARLAALAEELRRTLLGVGYLQEVSPRVRDRIASFGERAAVVLAETLLADAGLPVEGFPDGDTGLTTDPMHGDARILKSSADEVRRRFGDKERVFVVPGFIGKDEKGNIATLGRGGSDYTATFIGAALGVDTTLFKDVEGLLTADPKVVPDARPIERLHYLDALELAHYGTKAIAEKAILPAMRAGSRIEIRGFNNPALVSTIEAGEADVLAITCVRRVIMADFEGVNEDMLRTLSRIFLMFADTHTFPLLLTEASPRGETSIVLKEEDYPRLAAHLRSERLETTPKVTEDLGVVAVIGSHMKGRVGFAASIFQCLASHGINIVAIAQTASERNVSVIVGREVVEDAVRALHARFIGRR